MFIRIALVTILTMGIFGFGSKAKAIEVGAEAPRVEGLDQDGALFHFADAYAKGVTLVFFYPKADTPGCTAQACSLRDAFESLKAENLQVVGVSRDNADAQKKFQGKYHLPFPLVADSDGKVAEAFGVPGIFGMPITKRQSFLVKDGKVVWKAESAETAKHAVEVQAALDALK
jgi:thioredoxin-dependent peroxiredoxin